MRSPAVFLHSATHLIFHCNKTTTAFQFDSNSRSRKPFSILMRWHFQTPLHLARIFHGTKKKTASAEKTKCTLLRSFAQIEWREEIQLRLHLKDTQTPPTNNKHQRNKNARKKKKIECKLSKFVTKETAHKLHSAFSNAKLC